MFRQADDADAAIAAFQARGGPTGEALAATLTVLGDELVYLLLIPVVFWMVSMATFGARPSGFPFTRVPPGPRAALASRQFASAG